MDDKEIGYLCGVDWQHELNATLCWVCKSIEALKKQGGCWVPDGIVKFEIENAKECLIEEEGKDYWIHNNKVKAQVNLIEWVHPQNFDLLHKTATSLKDEK